MEYCKQQIMIQFIKFLEVIVKVKEILGNLIPKYIKKFNSKYLLKTL